MIAYTVTGTDTSVGKTTVTRGLLRAAHNRGLRPIGFKPIESGCPTDTDGQSHPLDAIALAQAALDSSTRKLYCFREPLSPHIASSLDSVSISLAAITEGYQALAKLDPGLLLVEGAGGFLVPIGPDETIADMASALALPILIVARAGLGTINHTLLTVGAVRARGLSVASVLLCDGDGQTSIANAQRNADAIREFGEVEVQGPLPFLSPDTDDPALAEACESAFDLDRLFSSLADTKSREQ